MGTLLSTTLNTHLEPEEGSGVPIRKRLDAALPSNWALVLYSRGVIQKKAWPARDQKVRVHLNGRAASNEATDDLLLPTFEVEMRANDGGNSHA